MPADVTYYGTHPLHDAVGVEIVAGKFVLAAGPAMGTVSGVNFTAAYTGVGVYTITLKKAYTALISGVVCLQQNTMGDQFASLGAVDVVTAKTVVLNVWDISGAAAADIATDGSQSVNFYLVLQK